MKYKVGDKVRVKNRLELDDIDDHEFFVADDMKSLSGKECKITRVLSNSSYYLDIDNSEYYWTDDMIELVHKKKNCFKIKCLDDYYDIMTKGKIYEFIDGQFRHNNGNLSLPYSSFCDFVRRNHDYEVELVEETLNSLEDKDKEIDELNQQIKGLRNIKKIQLDTIKELNEEIESLKLVHDEQLELLEEKRKEIEDLKEDREKLVSDDLHSSKKINEYLYEIGKLKKHIKKLYKHIDKISPERMDL